MTKNYRDLDGTTLGIEVEFHRINPCALENFDTPILYSIHDDGSTRETTYRLAVDGEVLAIAPHVIHRGGREHIILPYGVTNGDSIGLEMVTRPHTYNVLREHLPGLSEFLAPVPQTPRTSIHVHVDIAYVPWVAVRNVLKWAHALEAVLYRLSCGGMMHRGERDYKGRYTDHMFARPLSNPIGAVWGTVGSNKPLILWDRLMAAKTASEFTAYWGRADMYFSGYQNLPHYVGHRLHMINLVSALRYGTLEWRLFDALYDRINLIVDVVVAIHRLGYSERQPDFEPMPLGSEPDVDHLWVSRLLDMDVEPLWGKRWPKGCQVDARDPHYGRISIPTLTQTEILTMRHDSGDDYVPLARR